jgi:hypothetical protein
MNTTSAANNPAAHKRCGKALQIPPTFFGFIA